MPNILRRFFILGFSLFAFLFLANSSFASTLYVSPGSANIPSGSVKYVTVGINTAGESVNGVSAYLSYPADKLQVVSLSYGGAFPIAAEGSYGGGFVKVSRGSISGFVGSATVATVGFKGLAQGSATVSFVGGSAAARTSNSTDSLNLGGSAGAVFNVTAPVPGGSAAANSLKITNVKVTNISTDSATVTWQTDQKADSTVEYGLEKDNYILSEYDKALVTDHSVVLSKNALSAGADIHLRVKSKASSGDEGASDDYSFHLRGYNVTITVLDSVKAPIQNAEVLLYPGAQQAKTDDKGQAKFADASSGKHTVAVKLSNGFAKLEDIEVKETDAPQTFVLGIDTMAAQASSSTTAIYLALMVAVLILVVLVVVFIILRRRGKNSGINNPPIVGNMEQFHSSPNSSNQ